jgi:hypothetical protein
LHEALPPSRFEEEAKQHRPEERTTEEGGPRDKSRTVKLPKKTGAAYASHAEEAEELESQDHRRFYQAPINPADNESAQMSQQSVRVLAQHAAGGMQRLYHGPEQAAYARQMRPQTAAVAQHQQAYAQTQQYAAPQGHGLLRPQTASQYQPQGMQPGQRPTATMQYGHAQKPLPK